MISKNQWSYVGEISFTMVNDTVVEIDNWSYELMYQHQTNKLISSDQVESTFGISIA